MKTESLGDKLHIICMGVPLLADANDIHRIRRRWEDRAEKFAIEVRRDMIPRTDVNALLEAVRELLSIDDDLCSVPTDADFVTAYLRGDEARAKLRALISKRGAQ